LAPSRKSASRNFVAGWASYRKRPKCAAQILTQGVGGFMKKTIGKLMAMCFLTVSLAAFAQSGDAMKQEEMKHDEMKQDQMKQDDAKKGKKSKKTKKDKMKKDEMKKDDGMKHDDGMKQN
jgi:pentapeptide MXKDX repeat protein